MRSPLNMSGSPASAFTQPSNKYSTGNNSKFLVFFSEEITRLKMF